MNDLATIAKKNADAVEANIPREQAKGKHVVATYNGLNFEGYSTHESQADALEKVQEEETRVGVRTRLFEPTNVVAEVKAIETASA